MGIKNLNTLIEKYSPINRKKHLSYFRNKTFAIDTNVYLYKYLYGKSNHIDGMFFMINKFKKFNINPIFVFDGKPPEEKKNTIEHRKLLKNKLQERLMNLKAKLTLINIDDDYSKLENEIKNIEKKIIYVNKSVIDKTKLLFNLMGITYIEANSEAEHYCSKLCKLNLVDGVVSEDMDTVACGSKLVLRNFTNRDDFVEAYYLNDILYDLELNYDEFVDLCILLGNDYNYRPRGFNPDKILKLILKYRNIENILKKKEILNWNCNYEKIRKIIKLNSININKINNKNMNISIDKIKDFLKKNSNIDEKTYIHRINLIYPRKQFNFFKSKYSINMFQIK